MAIQYIHTLSSVPPPIFKESRQAPSRQGRSSFSTLLQDTLAAQSNAKAATSVAAPAAGSVSRPPVLPVSPITTWPAAAPNQRQQVSAPDQPPYPLNDLGKYKEDQLLSNPGGDQYYLGTEKVIRPAEESFLGRIGKNIADAAANIKNFFKNLFSGAATYHRAADNTIKESRQPGLISSIIDFCKDVGSGLSFGLWRPDGEVSPRNGLERLAFAGGKMREAVVGDLMGGVGNSINHLTEDLLLAGWNLIEVIPDATIGNFKAGRHLTTTIFDDGQVVIDYLTDILPFGEAWLRVHAPNLPDGELPLVYNLKLPEQFPEDERWRNIRNTPFRKQIETIGSLLADIVTFRLAGHVSTSSEKRR